jgi:hypothetical protein
MAVSGRSFERACPAVTTDVTRGAAVGVGLRRIKTARARMRMIHLYFSLGSMLILLKARIIIDQGLASILSCMLRVVPDDGSDYNQDLKLIGAG